MKLGDIEDCSECPLKDEVGLKEIQMAKSTFRTS